MGKKKSLYHSAATVSREKDLPHREIKNKTEKNGNIENKKTTIKTRVSEPIAVKATGSVALAHPELSLEENKTQVNAKENTQPENMDTKEQSVKTEQYQKEKTASYENRIHENKPDEKNNIVVINQDLSPTDRNIVQNKMLSENKAENKSLSENSEQDTKVSGKLPQIKEEEQKKEERKVEESSELEKNTDQNERLPAIEKNDSGKEIIKEEKIEKEITMDSIPIQEDSPQPEEEKAEEEKKEKKQKKMMMIPLSADVFLSPSLNHRTLTGNAQVMADKEMNEKMKLASGGGLRLNYSFSEKLYMSLGLVYSNYGEKYRYEKENRTLSTSYVGTWKPDTTGGGNMYYDIDTFVTETKSVKIIKRNNYYRYFSIPVYVTYAFGEGNGKMRFSLSAAFSTNMLVNAYSYRVSNDSLQTEIIETSSGDNNPFRRVTTSLIISPAITYNFNERWKLLLEPGVGIFLNSVYKKEYLVSHKPYALEIKAGLRYMLK